MLTPGGWCQTQGLGGARQASRTERPAHSRASSPPLCFHDPQNRCAEPTRRYLTCDAWQTAAPEDTQGTRAEFLTRMKWIHKPPGSLAFRQYAQPPVGTARRLSVTMGNPLHLPPAKSKGSDAMIPSHARAQRSGVRARQGTERASRSALRVQKAETFLGPHATLVERSNWGRIR